MPAPTTATRSRSDTRELAGGAFKSATPPVGHRTVRFGPHGNRTMRRAVERRGRVGCARKARVPCALHCVLRDNRVSSLTAPGGGKMGHQTGTREPRPTSWRRSRILISIAIGILPMVVLAAANLWRQVQEGEQRVEQDRIALARAAALTVSGFVYTSFASLQTLAATPTIADPTPRPELTDLL